MIGVAGYPGGERFKSEGYPLKEMYSVRLREKWPVFYEWNLKRAKEEAKAAKDLKE